MLIAALFAAQIASAAMSVRDLERRHNALTDKIVRVHGRLAECHPLSCGLLDDGPRAESMHWLSFDNAPAFDRSARHLIGKIVTVEGTVLADYWPDDGPPCLDRAPQFRPLHILHRSTRSAR